MKVFEARNSSLEPWKSAKDGSPLSANAPGRTRLCVSETGVCSATRLGRQQSGVDKPDDCLLLT